MSFKIGEGVSGVVSKCIYMGVSYAVKKFNEDNIAFDEEEFKSELAMMSVLRHPNIVHSVGGCTQKGNLFIIAKLYRRGSLADCLGLTSSAKNLKIPIDIPTSIGMLIDAAQGFVSALFLRYKILSFHLIWTVCSTCTTSTSSTGTSKQETFS